ncbi:CHRD domain-containing protein [Alkalicoccus halolimnae]|uniref:CHRD domain-containing protein n=1 Tax=Alkalicoccus halolimnae TaxID=1667239 RepID=A0AAJ8LTB3_9BACI|nr:CHRD domain-containing protein [Alkalicoccus halolimnae]
MKKSFFLSFATVLAFAGWMGSAAADSHEGAMFTADLDAEQEVHDVESDGSGHAEFELNAEQTEVTYTVEVSGMEGVTMSHIHSGEAGEDGPVEVDFLGGEQEPEDVDGELASGTFGEDDLAGDMTWDELLEAMTGEGLYVNVHTDEYPAGEIRGQIMEEDTKAEDNDMNETDNDADAGSDNDEEGNEMAATASTAPLFTLIGMLAALAGGALILGRRRGQEA